MTHSVATCNNMDIVHYIKHVMPVWEEIIFKTHLTIALHIQIAFHYIPQMLANINSVQYIDKGLRLLLNIWTTATQSDNTLECTCWKYVLSHSLDLANHYHNLLNIPPTYYLTQLIKYFVPLIILYYLLHIINMSLPQHAWYINSLSCTHEMVSHFLNYFILPLH